MENNAKCKICGNGFVMGWNGTVDGCDKCTKTMRDSSGHAWSSDEKQHVYLNVGTKEIFRVKRQDALNPKMKHFKVIYTNGEYYYTQANGTAAEFEAYLKQDGGRITFEDSNGKEFHRWIDRVEEVKP